MKLSKINIVILSASALLILGVWVGIIISFGEGAGDAVLAIKTPPKVSISESESVVVDVTISDLGETLYPAMSANISFDSSRLEFIGLKEGNVFIHDDRSSSGQSLPEWSCNVKQCNQSGKINLIYLDLSGGKYAFDRALLAKEDNVIFRLEFRLRGSVRKGDVCDLAIEDAVFAASDESQSLATLTNTLKAKNGKIVIGE